MTLLLAVDTATAEVAVAVGEDGRLRGEIRLAEGRRHAEQLAPAIAHLCEQTGVRLDALAALAVGVGPGLFTGLRVGVTTVKVMAQALGVPVVAVPSLDLVAYPLRHARRLIAVVVDARRREVFHARYRPVPGGVTRVSDYTVGPATDVAASLAAEGEDVVLAGDGVDPYRSAFADLDGAEVAGPDFDAPSAAALLELATRRLARDEVDLPAAVQPLYLRDSDAARVGVGPMTVTAPLLVHVVPMRRRHLRSVLRIEGLVYPRPWSHSLFLSELALRGSRAYFVARVGRDVTGYAGLMLTGEDGHVTTIAVDPAWHRRHIGTRLLLVVAREAIARGAKNMTLEVRLSNRGAQELYRRFGFAPVGVRKNYYQETHEDALVMWVRDVDTPDYAALLAALERSIPGETSYDDRRR